MTAPSPGPGLGQERAADPLLHQLHPDPAGGVLPPVIARVLRVLQVCYLQQQHGMLPSLAKLGAMAGQGDTVACEGGIQVSGLCKH